MGTLFLFLLLILLGGFSLYYLAKLKTESRNIIKDNYETLDYCHTMQRQLDGIRLHSPSAIQEFDLYLKKQEANITEPGEGKATKSLREAFDNLVGGDSSELNYNRIENSIQAVLSLNMQAIEKKNNYATSSSESAIATITAIATIAFIIGISFVYNFPGVLVTPIKKFTEAIKEISKKNYRHRIHLESKDEFGQLAGAFNDMTERLEDFENSNLNKLIFEKTRAEAVINSLKDASIGIDKNNSVLFVNEQALQLLGLKSEQTIGKSVSELSDKNDLFRFLITNESNAPFKIVMDGKENYFVKELIEVGQGETSNKVIVLKNITSFKELDVAKTNFIATISHELKTPLASSDFSLKLLEDNRVGTLTGEQKDLIQQIKSDNQRMLKILSELLNMSQVEAGKIQLTIQSVSPSQVIESSIMAVRSTAKEKEITIEQNIEKDLPDFRADADKVSWVLNNFLTNAIRYSPFEGTVIVAVAKAKNQLSFAVTDHGPGIDQVYINQIFERYFQIPGRSDKKGSGIGLAICKEFIEAMGGKVWVKSQIGEGSTFGFDIPLGLN
ncbi:sensor histidine kinase [Terrimonas alba]|uniref:sensor histidine kinase n=1 Tax=Terrimonas alba TaxID=3349636 RepID=UPI0035F34409